MRLAALWPGPNEGCTVSITDHIERRTARSVRRANVYTTLQRLAATRLGDARPERGGRTPRLVAVLAA